MDNMIECPLCGQLFVPCRTCGGKLWRAVVCSPEHFFPYTAIIEYSRGKQTKAQAAETIRLFESNYGKPRYSDNVKSIIAEILEEKPYTETLSAQGTDDTETVETPRKRRRRSQID